MHTFQVEISLQGKILDAKLQSLEGVMQNTSSSCENWNEVLQLIPSFIDFGKVPEAFELCEQAIKILQNSNSHKLNQHKNLLTMFQIYLAHIDLSRKRSIKIHQEFFENLLIENEDALPRAHAFSALGLIAVFEGRLDLALERFNESAKIFRAQNEIVTALKAQVRQIMALRCLLRFEEAHHIAALALQEAISLGVSAIAPLLILHSTLGSICLELGKKFEAVRHMRESAKLSKIMPPSAAGAFAIFQYGKIQSVMGRTAEALTWLKLAEKMQRTLDPIARISTLLNILRCHSLLENWSEAREVSFLLLDSKLKDVDWHNVLEIYDEAIQLALHLHFPEQAQKWHRELENWPLEECIQVAEKNAFLEQTKQRIGLFLQKWNQAPCISPKDGEPEPAFSALLIDLAEGSILGKKKNGKFEFLRFRAHTLMGFLLAALFENAQKGNGESDKETLRTLVSLKSEEMTEASLRRQVDRLLATLVGKGFVTQAPDTTQFMFARGAAISCYALGL
jgi:tetratricopeptide (TPR) repeat protein